MPAAGAGCRPSWRAHPPSLEDMGSNGESLGVSSPRADQPAKAQDGQLGVIGY